jgi:hypothetical protein
MPIHSTVAFMRKFDCVPVVSNRIMEDCWMLAFGFRAVMIAIRVVDLLILSTWLIERSVGI